MNYYKRHLGDYAKKAGRLSMLQHGSYTLLLDACYDREQFPTLDEAIEWTWASTTEEVEAVTFVLRKFFTFEDGVYVQKRIQKEIFEYHTKAATNKRIAIERETIRKQKGTNRAPVVNDSSPNHKPITNNQEPREDQKLSSASPPDFEVAWANYPKRPGASKEDTLKAWKARIKAGADPAVMIDGVNRYAAYCRVKQTQPDYIKQPQTFFGPGKHYLSDWTPWVQPRGSPNNRDEARTIAANSIFKDEHLPRAKQDERTIDAECTRLE